MKNLESNSKITISIEALAKLLIKARSHDHVTTNVFNFSIEQLIRQVECEYVQCIDDFPMCCHELGTPPKEYIIKLDDYLARDTYVVEFYPNHVVEMTDWKHLAKRFASKQAAIDAMIKYKCKPTDEVIEYVEDPTQIAKYEMASRENLHQIYDELSDDEK